MKTQNSGFTKNGLLNFKTVMEHSGVVGCARSGQHSAGWK